MLLRTELRVRCGRFAIRGQPLLGRNRPSWPPRQSPQLAELRVAQLIGRHAHIRCYTGDP